MFHTQGAARLFDGWQDSMIWSCLQGVMGKIYADDDENPRSAAALLGDFCFLAGEPEEKLFFSVPEREFLIMVPQNRAWAALIEACFGKRAERVTRYAFRKDTVFDEEKLVRMVNSLRGEYTLRMMDRECYRLCREHDWSRDLVSNFADYDMYQRLGIGAVILKNGMLVSGASSYSAYREGIEIEIDTQGAYRRNGLASICGAKLILECRKRGLYPSWDAQNKASAALAEKLGYIPDGAYTAYEIRSMAAVCGNGKPGN